MRVLIQACSIVEKRHAITLNVTRSNGNWRVYIGNGGLIFSDQFLNTCAFTTSDFVEIIEKEVIFRGMALQDEKKVAV